MDEPQTLSQAFILAARLLREAGIETPELDARLLLCHASGLTHEAFVARAAEPMEADATLRLEAMVARRLAREPVSRITGIREFYGRAFRVTEATLDPRPDTETLIEAALDLVEPRGQCGRQLRLLDLGAGTGCILVTLLAELPQATGIGTDLSPEALMVAAENAHEHGVAGRASFRAGHWLDPISEETFDLILSNPPYLDEGEMAARGGEVSHDPQTALDGGTDGLDAYRSIVLSALDYLKPGGQLLLEIGATQAEKVMELLAAAGFETGVAAIRHDLAGRPRCLIAGGQGADGRNPRKLDLENRHAGVRFEPIDGYSRPSAFAKHGRLHGNRSGHLLTLDRQALASRDVQETLNRPSD